MVGTGELTVSPVLRGLYDFRERERRVVGIFAVEVKVGMDHDGSPLRFFFDGGRRFPKTLFIGIRKGIDGAVSEQGSRFGDRKSLSKEKGCRFQASFRIIMQQRLARGLLKKRG